ncbi:Glycerophosphoryl diester phosphodiesterase family [Trypanosoma brucei equiperdum]|uniref:Glycerophosphoryl diester phosphodiesterase family n=1 Tax=Trypanosoma brucei equiperdum TaxID=630700 RepID=A0A3L6LBM2_9TRYP|nr:Glycerophosphoryl diester phosphodiesterase family [Trypanosoma brucei equiperdum]
MAAVVQRVSVTFEVTGLNAGALNTELSRFSTPALHQCFTSPEYGLHTHEHQKHRYVPPAISELRLGIVSDAEEMGAWGFSAPLVLEETVSSFYLSSEESTYSTSGGSNADYDNTPLLLTATAQVPASCVENAQLRYRLVIVDELLLQAAAISSLCPGAAIVAVENSRTQPSKTDLRRVNRVNRCDSGYYEEDGSEVPMFMTRIDLRSLNLHFARASGQFPFLSQLRRPNSTDGNPRGAPYLSLSMYGNDPRVRYDRKRWLESLPKKSRDAVLFMEENGWKDTSRSNSPEDQENGDVVNPSTIIEVCDVYPVPSEGCCWCEGHVSSLPPMEQQIRMVKKQLSLQRASERGNASAPTSTTVGNTPSIPSQNTPVAALRKYPSLPSVSCASACDEGLTEDVVTAVTAFTQRGWCVEPLRLADPVAPMTRGAPQHTMRMWHTTVNLALLAGCGLQVEVMLPTPIYGEKERNGGTSVRKPSESASKKNDVQSKGENTESRGAAATGDTPETSTETPPAASEVTECESSTGVTGIRWLRGFVMLQPPLFEQRTNGTLVMPVCFPEITVDSVSGQPTVTAHWHTLYLQYLLVYPFANPERNTLEIVRSVASRGRLSTKKLVGHRGLGKTYTRGPVEPVENFSFASNAESVVADGASPTKRGAGQRTKAPKLMVKLAENSLESLNAAHRRGCDMVEFDVMLTRDRVPIVYHDPLIQLQARGKRGAGTRNGRVNSFGSPPDEKSVGFGVSPSFIADSPMLQPPPGFESAICAGASTSGKSLRLKEYQMFMRDPPQFSSVPIALHQLTKNQLDVVITETFTHIKAGNRLRNLILQHWHQILRVYRNRVREELACKHANQVVEVAAGVGTCVPCTKECTEKHGSVGGNHAIGGCADINSESGGDDKSNSSTEKCHNHCPSVDDYISAYNKHKRIISQEENVTNRICTLQDLFEGTAPSLRFDLEVKFPFQPIADANLFLQTDSFEVNAFVDDILQVVFAFADQQHSVDDGLGGKTQRFRDVIFSSFEPDVCLALRLKQSRYHVVYLCDTELGDDFKDYRSFGRVEGALQFSILMNLSGISIHAPSLCTDKQLGELKEIQGMAERERGGTFSYPNGKGENTTHDGEDNDNDNDDNGAHVGISGRKMDEFWSNFDCSRGRTIVNYAHGKGQQVWTWGEMNMCERFRAAQSKGMKVDAIITDTVPKWATDGAAYGGMTVST